jgi:hypothetical protein
MHSPLSQDFETLLVMARSIPIVREIHGCIPKPEKIESTTLTLIMIRVTPVIFYSIGRVR